MAANKEIEDIEVISETSNSSENKTITTRNQINVAYYRVSTEMQGASGLGLDAQKYIVRGYLRKEPDFEFIDIESGSKPDRKEFAKAVEKCKEYGFFESKLVIATLNRLTRDVEFLTKLQKSDVNFVCCDNPNLTPMVAVVMTAFAQDYIENVSKNTKNAIAVIKRRNPRKFVWGGLSSKRTVVNPGKMTADEIRSCRIFKKGEIKKGCEYIVEERLAKNMRKEGRELKEIRDWFNSNGFRTSNGGMWHSSQVLRLVNRVNKEDLANVDLSKFELNVKDFV